MIFDGRRKEPPLNPPVYTSPDGLISFGPYRYRVYAFHGNQVYNLFQIDIGRAHTEDDFIAFGIIGESDKIQTTKFQLNVALGEEVYMDGIAPVSSTHNKELFIDMIDTLFIGKLEATIENVPPNPFRLTKLYRIKGSVEPGFSGGPVYNKEGEVIGMTAYMSFMLNFTYAISAEDLQKFISNLNAKK